MRACSSQALVLSVKADFDDYRIQPEVRGTPYDRVRSLCGKYPASTDRRDYHSIFTAGGRWRAELELLDITVRKRENSRVDIVIVVANSAELGSRTAVIC